jgi:hypothetical protein
MAASQNFFFRRPTAGGPVDAMGTGLPQKEIKNYKFKLSINGSVACIHGGFQGKYQYEQFRTSTTGFLTGASVTIEGTAGSLVRVEAKWKIHRDVLDQVDAGYLKVGARGSVEYSRDGIGGSSGYHEIRVYDCSFTINQDNTVDIQVKCIGASQGALYINLYAGFAALYGNLNYRADYAEPGATVTLVPCQNIVDLIDFTVQLETSTLTNAAFDPTDCASAGNWKVRYDKNKGDKLFKSEYMFDQDLTLEATRGVYVTLNWILDKINRQLSFAPVAPAESSPQIELRATADLYYDPIGWIPSANPMECIFSYSDPNVAAYTDKGGIPPTDSNSLLGYSALGNDGGAFPMDTNLGNILINRNVIAGIIKENTAIKTSPGILKMFPLKEYYMTIETFFKKLFEVINANSGGALDLDITLDPDAAYSGISNKLIIINNRGKETKPAPYEFKKGMFALRQISITSKVPSATAAAAFSADANSAGGIADASDNAAANAVAGKSAGQASDMPSRDELNKAKMTAATANFTSETCDGLRGVIRRAVAGQSTAATLNKTSVPWPLELKLTFVGVAGWRFGDTISYNDLPARYKDGNGAAKVGFTTIRVQHQFGDEWTTDLVTQCRFLN